MKIYCPTCQATADSEQVAVFTDTVECRKCGQLFSISAILMDARDRDAADINQPPHGTSLEYTATGWRLQASTRSWLTAMQTVPFTCVFTLALLGLLRIFLVGLGAVGFLVLVPFMLGALWLWSLSWMYLFGTIVVSVDRDDGRVFYGVGPIGWTRRFRWQSVSAVDQDWAKAHFPGATGLAISLRGQRRLEFGSLLNDTARVYFVGVLSNELIKRLRSDRPARIETAGPDEHSRVPHDIQVCCVGCHRVIEKQQLNVSTNVALCEHCNEVFSVTELMVSGHRLDSFDIYQTPRGVTLKETDIGWTISSSTLSPIALFSVPFACVWALGASLVVVGCIEAQFSESKPSLVLTFVAAIFAAAAIVVGSYAAMVTCGKTVVSQHGNHGRVFTGVGTLGRTQHFNWSTITDVEEAKLGTSKGRTRIAVVLKSSSGQRLQFATWLNSAQRYYVVQAIKTLLSRPDPA